ncbi:hypothetical protein GCM10027275_02450 [Rhabdobacter roseus]|uniref:Uncharacterized protein n=1 Tax=Rhabdobacter roseus TaxID=1655419 RepID=A0A840TLM7_9BACT|nr:DUF6686 family protein [Rhabdobacter roseus]MBB5282133.1 hypothetical protein [Rhabdobacter roseus]
MANTYHSNTELRLLSQKPNGYIGQCPCCEHYNFVFKNFLFVFNEDSLRGFQEVLYDEKYLCTIEPKLPHGKGYLLPSPLPNFMLVFTEKELEELRNLFQEALLTLEVERLLRS